MDGGGKAKPVAVAEGTESSLDSVGRRRLDLHFVVAPNVRPRPNGSRLSCGRLAPQRKAVGRQSVPRQGHNTPLPLERSPPASFKRLLGAAATGPFSSFPSRHGNGFLSPRAQRVGILHEVLRHLVVLHGLTVLAIGPAWTHAACLEVASIGVVDLEVKCVVGDQGEEQVTRIDTDAPEHAPCTYMKGNAA